MGGWHQDEVGSKDVPMAAKSIGVMLLALELYADSFGDDMGIYDSYITRKPGTAPLLPQASTDPDLPFLLPCLTPHISMHGLMLSDIPVHSPFHNFDKDN